MQWSRSKSIGNWKYSSKVRIPLNYTYVNVLSYFTPLRERERQTETETERQRETESITCVSVGSIQVGKLNVLLLVVGPVDAIVDVVQRQGVGREDLLFQDDGPVGSIHPHPLYVLFTPVCPVQEAVRRH